MSGPASVLVRGSDGEEVDVTTDQGQNSLRVTGKVAVTGSVPPPATNAFVVVADNPLTVGSDDTEVIIPAGEDLHLQAVTFGNEDPTKGARIEVIYDDGAEHLVFRGFCNGRTISFAFADVTAARDGTTMVGNGTNKIIVRREKYSGTDIAIDAVLRGYSV